MNLTKVMMDGRDLTPEQVEVLRRAVGVRDLTPERLELLRRAVKRGLDLVEFTPRITPQQIIQAAIDPPAASLRLTDETTDEELSAFIRGERRGCHY